MIIFYYYNRGEEMRKSRKNFFLILAIAFIFFGCGSDTTVDIRDSNESNLTIDNNGSSPNSVIDDRNITDSNITIDNPKDNNSSDLNRTHLDENSTNEHLDENQTTITVPIDDSTPDNNRSDENISVIVEDKAISGKVVDGEIAGATVFLDLNKNGELDSGEPSSISEDEGSYRLTLTAIHQKDINYINQSAPLVAYGGRDIRTDDKFEDYLMAMTEGKSEVMITPITTLIVQTLQSETNTIINKKENIVVDNNMTLALKEKIEEIKRNLAELFDVNIEFLTKDPIALAKEGDSTLLSRSLQLHNSAKAMKKAMRKEVKNRKDAILLTYKALGKELMKIKKDALKDKDNVLVKAVNKALDNSKSFEKKLVKQVKKDTESIIKQIDKFWKDRKGALDDKALTDTIKDGEDKTIADKTPPSIRLIGSATVNLTQGATYSDAGATASDDRDGDITANITVSGSVDTAVEGTYTLTYSVVDSAGNSANQVTRTINVSLAPDTINPIIILLGSATVNLTQGATYSDAGATATDDRDGDITADIVVSGSVNSTVVGTYTIAYNVKDSAGNEATQIERTVTVVANTPPTTPPTQSGYEALTLDTDGDGITNVFDSDDDNDSVPDNEDYRPLDATIQTIPTHRAETNSTAQTYIRVDNNSSNYNNKSFIQIRSLKGNYASAGLLYFDIPITLNSKRVDKITSATLTLKSDTEKDSINIYVNSDANFPDENSSNWENVDTLVNLTHLDSSDLYGQVAMSAGASSSVELTKEIDAGKIVFIVDENGDDSKEKLVKESSEIRLDFEFQQIEPSLINIQQLSDTLATQTGGELHYEVSLKSQPTQNVYLPIALQDSTTATITSGDVLTFTPSNYATAQTIVIKGKDDGIDEGNKQNRLLLYPLHGDSAYNIFNPDDIDFMVYALLPTANSGEPYRYEVNVGQTAHYTLQNAPIGMMINETTGVLYWQPDSTEVGSHTFSIVATNDGVELLNQEVTLNVLLSGSNPTAYYVVPQATIKNPTGALGSVTNPYTSIATAVSEVSKIEGNQTIYVRGGVYDIEVDLADINGSENSQTTLTKLAGEQVKFNFAKTAFTIRNSVSYFTIDGFELDGNSVNDHWDMLANHWWKLDGDSNIGGGQAFNVDGQHITIRNNVIHDAFQKGVNIYEGRYVNVHNNIVYNIGHNALSGGHGIMRKWERNFHIDPTDGVDRGDDNYTASYPYRFDITGNLLFAVEQRIYSRVFNKGYSLFALDEGKAILIDITKDTNPKSRISHNLVLYCGVDHIRLKTNPNMEVHHNSVHTDLTRHSPKPDGITIKKDSNMSELKLYANLVVSDINTTGFEVTSGFIDADGNDSDPDGDRRYDNHVAGGGSVQSRPFDNTGTLAGITNKEGTDGSELFEDVAEGNFSSLITGRDGEKVGVSDEHLAEIDRLSKEYGVKIKSSGWVHDHFRNADTLVKNIPSTLFDREFYYVGDSSLEEGRKALYLKIIDSDSKWLYTKREEDNVSWNNLLNPDLTSSTAYDLQNVDIQKCEDCTGAYIYQLVLPEEWFTHYDTNGTKIVNSDGVESTIVYLDTNNTDDKRILEYSAEGKVKSY